MADFTQGLSKTFSDWLRLLDGPQNQVFSEIVEQEDWGRLFKLIVLVIVLSGTALGVKLGIQVFQKAAITTVLDNQLAMTFLIVGAMLAVLYNGFARLFGIKLSLPKSFFIIMTLLLPWVPIVNLIDAVPALPPFKLISIAFLVAHLLLIKPIYNFYQGVLLVTKVAPWRALISILLPITIFTFLVIYMFA